MKLIHHNYLKTLVPKDVSYQVWSNLALSLLRRNNLKKFTAYLTEVRQVNNGGWMVCHDIISATFGQVS